MTEDAQKQDGRTRKGGEKRFTRKLAVLFIVFSLAFSPGPAAAQFACEWPIFPWIVFGLGEAVQAILIAGMFAPPGGETPSLLQFETTLVQNYLAGGDEYVGKLNFIDITANIPGPVVTVLNLIGGLFGHSDLGSKLKSMGQNPTVQTGAGVVEGLCGNACNLNIGGLGYMDGMFRLRLDIFWQDLHYSMQRLMSQLYGADANSTRLTGSMDDSTDMTLSGIVHQLYELSSKKQHDVSDQTCQFDSISKNVGRSENMTRGMSSAYAQQFNDVGNMTKGSPAGNGYEQFNQGRFSDYTSKYCDPNENGGNSPCSGAATPPALAGATIFPSRTIFGKDTMDMTDSDPQTAADKQEAVQELVNNITGYRPAPPIATEVLSSGQGREQTMKNRQYAAQMDAINAVALSPVVDRVPAGTSKDPADPAAPDDPVHELNAQEGIPDASPTPSFYESMNATQNALGDPNYYMDMGQTGGTIAQKEVYLKAYNTMMLYKLIEKQEKIANAYAIETANMVQKYKDPGLQQGKAQ